ncbi:MAG: Cytochrom-c3-2 domain-containing protein [Burkholderia sp.]|jgi:cytochrome c peroxidase
MKKSFVAAMTLAVALAFGMGSASAAEKTLKELHGATFPNTESGWAVKDQCLKCHGPYDKLAEKTKNVVPNPHYSHLGKVECVECHKPDAPANKPELMCNSCHNFKLQVKAAK